MLMATVQGVSGAATSSATTSAVDSADLVNSPAGYPVQEIWPGAVDPATYSDQGPAYPLAGPPSGTWMSDQFGASIPEVTTGGGIQDTSWMTGNDGPVAPWDSNAGPPFAPSGAVNQELHAQDTGAVYQSQHVVPAGIGIIRRQTIPGQTYNREYVFDSVTGQYIPGPNGRTDYDQAQYHDPDPKTGGGYAPFEPGYAERPIMNNLAYEATPVIDGGSIYGVAGNLPDRAPYQDFEATSYEAPVDPIVNQPPYPAAQSGEGWLLG